MYKSLFFALKYHQNFIIYQQSHYREVPRWGVSNGARHNWKCFLAKNFLFNCLKKKKKLTSFYAKNVFTIYNVKKNKFAYENMKKLAS